MKPHLILIDGGRGPESDPRRNAGTWNREWVRREHGGAAFTTATSHVDVVNRRRGGGVRIFVGGSRTILARDQIAASVHRLPDDAVVLTSRTYGASAAVREAALARGLQLEVWSALTEQFQSNEEAYFARDEEVIRSADRVIAFWDGISTGTAHEVDYSKELRKPVELIVLRPPARHHLPSVPRDPFPGGDAA